MDIEEVLRKFPGTGAINWHRHNNDSSAGWVHSSSEVDSSVSIGPDAVVYESRLEGGLIVSGRTVMRSIVLGGRFRIYGGKWNKDQGKVPVCIEGSHHRLQEAKPGVIVIGCERHSITCWLNNYRKIGEKNGYSARQIEEYHAYLKMAATVIALRKRKKKVAVNKKKRRRAAA